MKDHPPEGRGLGEEAPLGVRVGRSGGVGAWVVVLAGQAGVSGEGGEATG